MGGLLGCVKRLVGVGDGKCDEGSRKMGENGSMKLVLVGTPTVERRQVDDGKIGADKE